VIKTPYIFSKIQRKFLSSFTTFGGKIPLEMYPEPFKTIDLGTFGIEKFTLINRIMALPILSAILSISATPMRYQY
jgi:hypothetical protein